VCGIVGILARNARLAPELLERATRSLAHRGPDDSGTIIIRDTGSDPINVGLGNRRLAILDLSPLGHQPMQDAESGNWIVHNGEVYNFLEVRQKLEREGVRFSSHSDTEVVLKAYGKWGERCLDEFRGMFAFAIWDARRHRLFIARDPMGIKPLYYYASDRYFLFASELRTLVGTELIPRRLDRAGLLNYLAFGSVYDPNTMIEGVRTLGPGQYLIWESGRTRTVTYWDFGIDLNANTKPEGARPTVRPDRAKAENDVYDLLQESVRLQMVSDVPVGAFLSGGIDSSAIVGLLSRAGVRLNTFSLVFRESEFNEAEYSRAIARQFGTEHQEISVSQRDVLDAIPGALQAMDQPTIDGINTYFISRQTRAAGVKVALTGLGGDELFGGYASFRTVPRMERFASRWRFVPGLLRRPLASALGALVKDNDQNRKLIALARDNGRLLHPYFLSRMLFTPSQQDQLVTGQDAGAASRAASPMSLDLERSEDLDPVNRVSYLESRCYMLNTLLRDSDVMSMAHGLEVRVPLLDHRLAQTLLEMPGYWKLDQATPKPLLVNALRGALPDNIVHRRKQGFTLPFEHWLKDELRPSMESGMHALASGPLGSVLNREAVRGAWRDFLDGNTSWSRPWSLHVLQRWCDLNCVTA
jgi:asparagine synthase (glutamine-hydrolysing)